MKDNENNICSEIVKTIKECSNKSNFIVYVKSKNFIDYKKEELFNCSEYIQLNKDLNKFHFEIYKNEILKRDKISITFDNYKNISIYL